MNFCLSTTQTLLEMTETVFQQLFSKSCICPVEYGVSLQHTYTSFCSLFFRLLPFNPLFPSDADVKVICSPDFIEIRVKEDFFVYYNVSLDRLHLFNSTCRARKNIIKNVTYYGSRISKEKYLICGGRPLEVQHNRNKTPHIPRKRFRWFNLHFLLHRKTSLTSPTRSALCPTPGFKGI